MIKLIIFNFLFHFAPATPETVFIDCLLKGVDHPDIVTKQFCLETGFGEHIYKNNLFGLYAAKGEFFSWRTSVSAYKEDIQDAYYQGGDYFEFLECMWKSKKGNCKRYAEDSLYIWKLKHIKVNLFSVVTF